MMSIQLFKSETETRFHWTTAHYSANAYLASGDTWSMQVVPANGAPHSWTEAVSGFDQLIDVALWRAHHSPDMAQYIKEFASAVAHSPEFMTLRRQSAQKRLDALSEYSDRPGGAENYHAAQEQLASLFV